ncbi:MAG: hypothetical protein R8M11_04510 [Gallionella sp.]
MLFDPTKSIEVRVLGPEGRPFVELENKYTVLFDKYDAQFRVPRLFSAPSKTTVAITIGVAVISTVASHLITQFIDEVFSLGKAQPNTEITINVRHGDRYILIEGDKAAVINKIYKYKDQESE